MKSKAISTIIATILMLLIVVALGGTSYLFISGALSSKTAHAFSLTDSVEGTVTIRNDGTQAINSLKAKLDNNDVAILISPTEIQPGRTGTITPLTSLTAGTHTLKLCSSSSCNNAILTILKEISNACIDLRTTCQTAQTNGICGGLDLACGDGYKTMCCSNFQLCCS